MNQNLGVYHASYIYVMTLGGSVGILVPFLGTEWKTRTQFCVRGEPGLVSESVFIRSGPIAQVP